jgi:sarcosine oxidase, subunit beta
VSGLPRAAGVVVIGGGAIGAATAYYLSVMGAGRVVLVERDTLASGSTGRATGGIRLQFSDHLNVAMMLRSLPVFEQWQSTIGAGLAYLPDIAFHQNGYLILLDDQADVDRFAEAIAMQRALGVPSTLLGPDEAAVHAPGVRLDGIVAAAWCPRDGYATPDAAVQGFAAAAAARGVVIVQRCVVTGIDRDGPQITAVTTSGGRIRTGIVVCAAGAWSPEIGRMVGVEIPVRGEAHTNWYSPDPAGLPDTAPLIIDFANGFHVRREGPGVLFGSRSHDIDVAGVDAIRRVPAIAEAPIQSEITGLYDTSPDANAIIGELDSPRRFLLATGFSGHGFMLAPAIGEHLAERVVAVTPTIDFAPLALSRFARGATRTEAFKI